MRSRTSTSPTPEARAMGMDRELCRQLAEAEANLAKARKLLAGGHYSEALRLIRGLSHLIALANELAEINESMKRFYSRGYTNTKSALRRHLDLMLRTLKEYGGPATAEAERLISMAITALEREDLQTVAEMLNKAKLLRGSLPHGWLADVEDAKRMLDKLRDVKKWADEPLKVVWGNFVQC